MSAPSPANGRSPNAHGCRIAALVVNFNTAELTLRCTGSLSDQGLARLLVVDNGSRLEDREILRRAHRTAVEVLDAPANLGFAGGCNLGIAALLDHADIDAVLLFNSDAVAGPGLVAAMREALTPSTGVHMVGARVMKLLQPDQIDSLGIAFYASCLASNRLDPHDPLFGPTGGCALYSRQLLEDILAAHGHVFDPAFFCYAEDTDLAARALLLGYLPALADRGMALHLGQASSGGGFSRFVLYHGIRNSIWMLAKDVPATLLLRHGWKIALLHAGIILRHSAKGEWRTVLALYRDALGGLPRVLRQRREVQRSRRISPRQFAAHISTKFYDGGMVRTALAELLSGRRR